MVFFEIATKSSSVMKIIVRENCQSADYDRPLRQALVECWKDELKKENH